MSTAELESQARQGDSDAYLELIGRWDGDLRAMVWSVVDSAASTDEVMERAAVAAFNHIDRFDGQTSMRTWLHTVCLRAAIEHARDGTSLDIVPPAVPDDVAALDDAFRSLDGVERLLVMLTTGLGHDIDDTATIVGMPSASVASNVSRALDRLRTRTANPDDAVELANDDLATYLHRRVPEPGAGHWQRIEAGLRGDAPVEPATPSPIEPPDTGGEADDHGVHAVAPAAAASARSSEGRNRLIAAGVVAALAIVGLLVFLNRAGDDSADTATDAVDASEGAAVTASGADTSTTAGASESNDGVQAEPASPDDAAELDAAPGTTPLAAISMRLNGEANGPAGPYCFTHPSSYVFPADELVDRRALLYLDVAADGSVSYTAMQGESIVIAGTGLPDTTGALVTTPATQVGASGAPQYAMQIADDQITVTSGEPPLALVDCNGPEVLERVNTMFVLLTDPTAAWEFAAWPPDDAVLSSAGLGPIRIGMTVNELAAELGVDLEIETIDGNTAGACGWVAATPSIARDVWILVELTSPDDGIIRRVSTFSGPWFTPSGITVGSTQQDVITTFPNQIEERPHVYTEGTYMRFLPNNADDPNTVEFVNEGGTIAEIRAGDRNWVGLIEGCA